jgi:hypothetical protein
VIRAEPWETRLDGGYETQIVVVNYLVLTLELSSQVPMHDF